MYSIEYLNTSNSNKMKLNSSNQLFPHASGSKIKNFITCTILLLFFIDGKYKISCYKFIRVHKFNQNIFLKIILIFNRI